MEADAELDERRRRSKWWLVVLVVGLVVFALMVRAARKRKSWSFFRPAAVPTEWETTNAKGGTSQVGPVLRLEDVIVRLQSGGAPRYLAIEFDLELGKQRDPKEMAKYMPRLREATLSFLSDRTSDDLRDSTRREATKRELLSHLRKVANGVEAVYISRMIVQQEPALKDESDEERQPR